MDRQEVIKYIASLSYQEKRDLLHEVDKIEMDKTDEKYERNRRSYKRQVAQHQALGELMKITVVPGDIVKCRGTNDGQGIREVIECTQSGISARKIERQVKINSNGPNEIVFVRAPYLTTHSWEKVAKILDIEIHEED